MEKLLSFDEWFKNSKDKSLHTKQLVKKHHKIESFQDMKLIDLLVYVKEFVDRYGEDSTYNENWYSYEEFDPEIVVFAEETDAEYKERLERSYAVYKIRWETSYREYMKRRNILLAEQAKILKQLEELGDLE